MPLVVDYSYDNPTIARLKSLGTASNPVVGVIRYVSPASPKTSKNLSPDEYAALKAAGFAVGLVWEGGASSALGGRAQGASDGKRANAQADALNYPGNAAIYFAVDFQATSSQMPTVLDYLRAADAASPRKIGVYGSYAVIEAAAKAGVGDYYWQTSAWSSGKVSSHCNLYQNIYHADTDVSDVVTDDWGQGSLVPPKPRPLAPDFPLPSGDAFGREVQSGHHLDVWQKRMAARGWTIAADGVYGPETRGVAHDFQDEKGLKVTGLIDARTWAAAWLVPVS